MPIIKLKLNKKIVIAFVSVVSLALNCAYANNAPVTEEYTESKAQRLVHYYSMICDGVNPL